jgi:hypothetical protein
MIGVFFRHPSLVKPVSRPQSNSVTRALSSPATNKNSERTSFSSTLVLIPPLKDRDSITSCPDVVEVPGRFEQIQLAQTSDDVLTLVSRRSEPETLIGPWISVSASEGQRPTHAGPYQEPHIPAYEPQLTTVPTVSSAPEVSMDCPQPHLDSMTFQQQQSSEAMDIDLDCPQSLMHRLRPYSSSTTESASPACPQYLPLQNQFSNASQSQFTNDVSGFSSSGRSFSYGSPMLPSTWAPQTWEEPLLPSPQEAFPTGLCAPEWTSSYTWPATITRASQPVIQPLQDINATEMIAFNVHPDTATPYLDFSQQLAPINSTRSSYAECISTGDMSPDENHDLSQPVSVDHVQMQAIDKNAHQPQTLPVSSPNHQPEVVPPSSSPVDTVKAKGEMATRVSNLEVTDVMNDSRRQR